MLYNYSFASDIRAVSNVYEIIARCYIEMLEDRPNVEEFFFDLCHEQVYKDKHRDNYFPELQVLSKNFDTLYQNILMIAKNYLRESLSNFCDMFLNELKSFSGLSNYTSLTSEDKKTASAICMGQSITILDKCVQDYSAEDNKVEPMDEPLNNKYKGCLVYRSRDNNFLMNVPEGEGKNRFRKKLKGESPNNYLNAVRLALPEDLPHNVTPYIYKVKSIQLSNFKEKKLRIAYIPYAGFKTFDFQFAGYDKPWDQKSEIKGVFHVTYSDDEEDKKYNKNRMLNLLEEAINKKANFVIFPEFITSEDMFIAMREYLDNRWNGKNKPEHLFLIFAGTTCTKNAKGEINNVLRVLTGNGEMIPITYCKYSHYNDKGMFEILSNRDKKIAIFDVENVGRILPAICKDAVNEKCTPRLVDFFDPNLILIPAWSISVNMFRPHLTSYAEKHHAISMMCNCCHAIDFKKSGSKERKKIGFYTIPKRKDDEMRAEYAPFKRGLLCHGSCRKHGGCINFLDIDYSKTVPKAKFSRKKIKKYRNSLDFL